MEITPSILKLLEEEEDETMHSKADVDAYQAALNRDIQGHTSISQPSHSNSERVLSQGNHQTVDQDGRAINLHSQQALQSAQQTQQNLPEMEHVPHGSIPENLQKQPIDVPEGLNWLSIQRKQSQDAGQIAGQVSQTTGMQTSQWNAIQTPVLDNESQCLKLQKASAQQRNPRMPSITGGISQIAGHHSFSQLQKKTLQASAQQNNPRMPSFTAGISQIAGHHSFSQLQNYPANSSHVHSPVVSVLTGSSYPSFVNNAQNSREMDNQSGSRIGVLGSQISSYSSSAANQEIDCASIPGQGVHKQQQRHLASYSETDVNTSGSSFMSQRHDSQMRQLTHHQSLSIPVRGPMQAMNMMNWAKHERQNSINDTTRLQGGSLSHISSNPFPFQVSGSKELKNSALSSVAYIQQKSVDHGAQMQPKLHLSAPQRPSVAQVFQRNAVPATSTDKPLEKQLINFGNMMAMNSVSPSLSSQLDHNVLLSSQNLSVTSPADANARKPRKKPSVGQKKPLKTLGSSPPLPSKKQKVSRAFSDKSIKQLNDVTAVSGVNLQEEVEQLFSGHKADSQVSEASRRVVHEEEEEERGILLKTPLRIKLTEIIAKHGLKNISNDVERCLSLSVEERMRGLLCNLIRLSKQRADAEKPMHHKLITSDVRQQVIRLNCKANEEWHKKKVEVEKLQKLDETNKKDDDKMMATAANVAARAAAGGDDMLSKWQLMAEQARQRRERGIDAASSSQARAIRKFGQNQVIVARTISVKDVIAVLDRDRQMSRSTLNYRLHERIRSMASD